MDDKASFRDFMERLSGLSRFTQEDPIQLHAELHKYRDRILHLLHFQGPHAEARQQISSQYVEHPCYGPQHLDNEDTRLALLLSNELKLDEIYCVELLITAKLERGEVSAEAAAGIFFGERRSIVTSLMHLLELHAFELYSSIQDPMSTAPQHIQVVMEFTQELLSERGEAGQDRVTSRLVELIRDNSLDLQPGSALTDVKDENGALVPRSQALLTEKVALCRCLLYAAYIKQRVNPSVVADTLSLLGFLCMKLRGEDGKQLLVQQQAYMVLLAAIQFVSPGQDMSTHERSAMRELASNAALKSKVEQVTQGDLPYGSLISLAWGILQGSLQMQQGTAASSLSASDALKSPLEAAVANGVFGTIKHLVESWFFMCEDAGHQQLCTQVLYTLLTDFLRLDETQNRHDIQKLLAHNALHRPASGTSLPAPPTASSSGALVLFNGGQNPSSSSPPQPDNLGTLLSALAAVLRLNPDMAYADLERWGCVGRLTARITMEHPDTQNVMQRSAEVRVPYVEVLAAMASGEMGASMVMKQMREYAKPNAGPASQVLTWRRFFVTIVEYCVRYFQLRGSGPGTHARQGMAAEQQRLMNSQDAAAIVAHLKLFKRIIENGNELEVEAWIDSLERELSPQLNNASLYEPLFQLMCHPVPNTVKAALDEALSAFACRKDYATRLLERFLQCVTDGVNPDISHIMAQLSEVEARNELFPETIALLDLMNQLVEQVMGTVVDSAQLSFFTEFVITQILGHLWRRGYREPEQKWQVAARSFQHLQLMLEMLDITGPIIQHHLERRPPGLVAMIDLLSGGPSMQAVLHVLEPGFMQLEATRLTSGEAPYREAAVTAALQLLVACMGRDEALVEDLGQFTGRGQLLHPVDAQFRPPFIPRLTAICKYVCYVENDKLQLEAIKLVSLLSNRLPNLVELLQGPDISMTACWEIRDGFTAALRQSLLAPPRVPEGMQEEAAADEEAITDARAPAVMRLMLDSFDSPALPSMLHLLMGYDCEARANALEESVLLPLREFSCLRVVMEAVRSAHLRIAQLRPKLFSQCLQILFFLADSPSTGPAMLELLANQDGNLGFDILLVLRSVLAQALPEARPALIATLQQHCWIQRLLAKRLLTGTDSDGSDAIIGELFGVQGRPQMMSAEEAAAPCINVLALLETLTNVQASQPVYNVVIPQQHRRLLADMVVDDISIEAMLTNDMVMARAGLCTTSEFGDTIFDFEQLKRLLKDRYDDYLAKSGQPGPASEVALGAVRAAFTYAQQFNAYVMTVGAQAAALEAWRQLVEVGFSKRYPTVCKVFPGAQLELLYSVLVGALEVIRHLVSSSSSLAQELMRLVCLLLGRLQDQAAGNSAPQGLGGQGGDVLSSVRMPARCTSLLKLLLEVARAGHAMPSVRWQVYEALLKYLQFCSGPKLARSPPAVLEALLQGYGQGSSVAKLDMAQTELEVGNSRLLRDYAPMLIQMLYKDSRDQGATKLALAVVFRVLAALVVADDTRAISTRLHDKQPVSVAEAVLKDVVDHADEVMLMPASKSQRALYVVEAQLELLVLLAQAVCQPGSFASLGGPTSAEALISFARQSIRMLADCRALDTAPEAQEGGQLRPMSIRYRLSHMVCPSLQLVLCITAALPSSREIRHQACQFVDAHSTLMLRLLRESVTGSKLSAPADTELRQLELVTSLVAHLAVPLSDITLMPEQMKAVNIRRAMFELSTLFCCQSSHSRSPIVNQLQHTDDAASGVKHQRYKSRVIAIRCSIVQYLRDMAELPQNPEVYVCVGKGGDPRADPRADGSIRPTLLLLQEAARQAGSDLRGALELLSRLLQLLACRDGELTQETVTQLLPEYCPPQLLSTCSLSGVAAQRHLLRHCMVSVASVLDRQLGRLLHLVETSLATVLRHFITFLPRPFLPPSDAPAGGQALLLPNSRSYGGWTAGPMDAERLGSEQDIRYFADKLKATVTELEDLISRAGSVPGHSFKDLDNIVHTLKRYLVHY